jgi:glycosyltransferase involved in cell wall biosynthesis
MEAVMKSYRVGFLMFQNLGHITHQQRMRLEIEKYAEIQPEWMPILPWNRDLWQRLPFIRSNQTLLMGLRARDQLSQHDEPFNALYCHTQEPAVLLGNYMNQIPTILSLDGTPIEMNSFGHAYGRGKRLKSVEFAKHLLIKRSFHRAAHLVAWSDWVKQSLINDYDIPDQKITINAPGLDLAHWNVSQEERADRQDDRSGYVLFVGGDFHRKGGELLIEAARSSQGQWRLEIITNDSIPNAEALPNVRIHRGLSTGTPEMLALYRNASIFVLPTLADCWSWVIMEAMAMRLPVIATRVGAMPELVIHGETGLLIPPNSLEALTQAIRELIRNPERSRAMGNAGRRRLEKYFDGAETYRNLVTLIKSIADAGQSVTYSS